MSREPEIMESQVMWEPDTKRNTHMDRFRAAVASSCGLRLANYDDLYQWSVESFSDFWAEFWKYSNIVCSRLYDESLCRISTSPCGFPSEEDVGLITFLDLVERGLDFCFNPWRPSVPRTLRVLGVLQRELAWFSWKSVPLNTTSD